MFSKCTNTRIINYRAHITQTESKKPAWLSLSECERTFSCVEGRENEGDFFNHFFSLHFALLLDKKRKNFASRTPPSIRNFGPHPFVLFFLFGIFFFSLFFLLLKRNFSWCNLPAGPSIRWKIEGEKKKSIRLKFFRSFFFFFFAFSRTNLIDTAPSLLVQIYSLWRFRVWTRIHVTRSEHAYPPLAQTLFFFFYETCFRKIKEKKNMKAPKLRIKNVQT